MGLIGRERELRTLAELVDRGSWCGGALALAGDPGIGKTALLDAAERLARRRGFRVLSALGVESEARLPFAGLHQLLRPVTRFEPELPPAQREALRSAFGLLDGARPAPFLIMLAAVNLVLTAAARDPVLVLADDVHWLDRQSQDALSLLAGRAAGSPVAIIAAGQAGQLGPFAGFPVLEVSGVDTTAAGEILHARGPALGPADRRRIAADALGNPLALLELPPATNGWSAPNLPDRLARAFAGRLTELPAPTRDALLVAAVDPVPDLAEILAAAAVLTGAPGSAEVLEPAVDARLVTVDGRGVAFRHPLVRCGILQSETVTRRQAANAALAAVLDGDPHRRTWHRAQSIVGPDEAIADELEADAATAAGRAAVREAIAGLTRAAELTRRPERRGHRLLVAAEHAFGLGLGDVAERLLRAAPGSHLSDVDSGRREWLRELTDDGRQGEATRVHELCDIAGRVDDRDVALNLLLGAALRCWRADTGPAARGRVAAAAEGLRGARDDPRVVAVRALAEPVLAAAGVLDRLALSGPGPATDADALRYLGMAAHAVGDPVRAVELLGRAETLLREQGRLGLLSQVLGLRALDHLELGDWARAAVAVDEGRLLALETEQPLWRTGMLACEARLNAWRGNPERAMVLAAETELNAVPSRRGDLLSGARLARGSALLSTGRPAEAYAELRRLFDPQDPSFHQRERFRGLRFLADAAVHSGHPGDLEDARAVLAGLEPVATITPAPLPHAHLHHARAVLAEQRAGLFVRPIPPRL